MHRVAQQFLALIALGVLAAFLRQQYVRSPAFSRGCPAVAAVQTGLVLAAATVLLTLGQILYPPM